MAQHIKPQVAFFASAKIGVKLAATIREAIASFMTKQLVGFENCVKREIISI